MKLAEEEVIDAIRKEYMRACMSNDSFNSAHEGYAVILEELDELWEEIKKKGSERDHGKMFKEAVQVATMGLRFAVDICMDDHGNIIGQ